MQASNSIYHCRHHAPELNLLSIPLAKVCPSCGGVEGLSGNDIYWPSVTDPRLYPSSNPHRRVPIRAAVKAIVLLLFVTLLGAVMLHLSQLQPQKSQQPPVSVQAGPSDKVSTSATAPRQPTAHEHDTLALDSSPELTNAPGHGTEITQNEGSEYPPESTETAAKEAEAASAVGPTHSNDPVTAKATGKLPTDKTAAVNRDSTFALRAADIETETRKIEKQIQTAILARAITGVTVSYERNTAYLQGRVKTETQRSAAEQAARSVPGVRNVRSAIQVEWF